MVDRKNYGVVTPLLVRGDGKGNQESSEDRGLKKR